MSDLDDEELRETRILNGAERNIKMTKQEIIEMKGRKDNEKLKFKAYKKMIEYSARFKGGTLIG